MITQRRVFRAKPRAAGSVVQILNEFRPVFERGGGPSCRIYTDSLSDETDRLVWEFDADSLAATEGIFGPASQNARY